jgi:branched-chain amino acid transport system substrate-binding protein
MEPKDVKVALIHEDGPYGVGVAAADEAYAKEAGLQVVLKEGYSASAPDLSVLVTKLKRARADVISHADTTRHHPVPAPGARERPEVQDAVRRRRGLQPARQVARDVRADIDNFCNIDPVPAQLLDRVKARAGIGDLTKIMVERYKEKTARPTCRRTARWASTRPGSCSTTCCPSPRRNMAASIPRRSARRRSTSTSRRAAPSRATA